MAAPLDRRLQSVKWGEFRLGDLFDSSNGDFDIQKSHLNGHGEYVITAGLSGNGILGKTSIAAKVFAAHTITVDMFGNAFYRPFCYKMVTHARVFSLKPKFDTTDRVGLFISNALKHLTNFYGYGNICSWEKIKSRVVQLPITTTGKIDFDFMESFIRELEEERIRELTAYLAVSGLDNCKLSREENDTLAALDKITWRKFNLRALFGPSTRGKRLKSDDRIPGPLPFITAGEAEEGFSAYIGNKVEVFARNTTTIDMFGSAKYRNYDYGADDHVAVVHTEALPKHAAIFVTTACHKAAHTGKFDYSRNFYAKDADALDIMLPITSNGQPDYAMMETLMRAVQKLVVKDVSKYAANRIAATREVVKCT